MSALDAERAEARRFVAILQAPFERAVRVRPRTSEADRGASADGGCYERRAVATEVLCEASVDVDGPPEVMACDAVAGDRQARLKVQ